MTPGSRRHGRPPMADAQRSGSDVSEQTKKNKTPCVMAVKRAALRLGMFPRTIQVLCMALAAFAIGLPIGYIGVQIVRRNSSGFPNNYSASQISLPTTGTRSFNTKPRLLQLVWDEEFRHLLDVGEMAPLIPQYQELIGRYNPLPNLYDNHKLNSASKVDRGKCHKMADWQTGHNPTCNVIHEVSSVFLEPYSVTANNTWVENIRLFAAGGYRHVWMFREFDGSKRVMKTLRVDKKNSKFDLRSFDRHRRDAVAMEQLSSSPLVVDIFGYCSNTGIFKYGEGGDLESIYERDPHISKEELLHIAYNVSMSLAHAHHYDENGHATIAHTDIKVDQFLYEDGYYKLTDFNRARFLLWNTETNKHCGFTVGKNGGQWRSPEEYAYMRETEKVDVYSLGNILYFLLTKDFPWDDLPTKETAEKVKSGKQPRIPAEILESKHPYDKYMVEAMQMCFTHDQVKRPSAKQVALKLADGIKEL
jgi:serine/threonine protein kinase